MTGTNDERDHKSQSHWTSAAETYHDPQCQAHSHILSATLAAHLSETLFKLLLFAATTYFAYFDFWNYCTTAVTLLIIFCLGICD